MCKQAVIVLVHGSRREQANLEALQLVEMLRKKQPNWEIAEAFVEFRAPSLEDSAEKLYQMGYRRIVVVPVFLTLGNHLYQGLPKRFAALKQKYNELELCLASHLGADPLLVEIIANRANALLQSENQ